MIKPISVLDNITKTKNYEQEKRINKPIMAPLPKLSQDSFEKTSPITFEARNVKIKKPTGTYEYHYKRLEEAKTNFKKYKDVLLPDKKWQRIALGIITLGGSEAYGSIKGKNNQEKDIASIIERITNTQNSEIANYKQSIEEDKIESQQILEEINLISDYFSQIDDIKNNQITPTLFTPLLTQSSRKGKTTIPNCVMISAGDKTTNDLLIETAKQEAMAKIVTIDDTRDITDYLQQAKEHYDESGERTLLHIKNMDTLINPNISSANTIGAMKSIMGNCSKFYKTTILFSSQNPEELDSIAMGPHRVSQIRTDLKEPQLFRVIDAKARLDKGVEQFRTPWGEMPFYYPNETKVPLLRDFLTITGLEGKGVKISDEPTYNEMDKIRNQVKNVIAQNFAEKLQNIDVKHTYEIEPTTINVQYNGETKQLPGYKHIITLDKDQIIEKIYKPNDIPQNIDLEEGLVQTFISPQKHLEYLPLHIALYNYFDKAYNEPIETSYYSDSSSIGKTLPDSATSLDIPAVDYYNDEDIMRKIILTAEKELFEQQADNNKTGDPTIDKVFTNPDTSPFSLRRYMRPKYIWRNAKEKEFITTYDPNHSDFKYDLLHSLGDKEFAIIKPKITLELNPKALSLLSKFTDNQETITHLELLNDLVERGNYDKRPLDYAGKNFDGVEIEGEDIEKIKATTPKIFASDIERTKEEIETQNLITRLKDKKRNVESPINALKDVITLLKLDEKGVSVNDNPSEEEMRNTMRAVKDEILNITIQDLINIPKVEPTNFYNIKYGKDVNVLDKSGYVQRYDFYTKHYFKQKRQRQDDIPEIYQEDREKYRRYRGLEALLLIADEHIANNPKGNLPMHNNYFGNHYYGYNLSTGGIRTLLKKLEHYETIKTASEALEGIARRPIWYYERGGKR